MSKEQRDLLMKAIIQYGIWTYRLGQRRYPIILILRSISTMSDDQEKLIRDLSHLGRVLSERVHDLEDQLEQCKRVFEALQRRVRQETKRHD